MKTYPLKKLWLSIACISMAHAANPATQVITFSKTQDVGYGNEVCVLGTSPLLGGSDATKAIKLVWSPGNVWTGKVALPAGETFSFSYVSRPSSAAGWCDAAQTTTLQTTSVTVPSYPEAPWKGKTIFYQSSWSEAWMLWRNLSTGGAWTDTKLNSLGAGTVSGTFLYRIDGIATNGANVEFVFHNGGSTLWDNAIAPPNDTPQGAAPAIPIPYQGLSGPYNYSTSLDFFHVQDGNVYNYTPTATVSAPRIETRTVNSSVAGIPARTVRIYLPRGYDQNTSKKYPVLYMHDGQNLFFPGGTYGTWDADRIATHETRNGRMRETIIVGIDNNSNRIPEYMPPSDSYSGTAGIGDKYAQFIRDNVIPTLDYNYRTLGTVKETFLAGSSLGGLISCYIAHNDVTRYGNVGIFSPAYWIAPNYVATRDAAPLLNVRRFLSIGSNEGSTPESEWADSLQAYNHWVGVGHTRHRDLTFVPACGAAHTETAWSALMPTFYQEMLDPWREAQNLILKHGCLQLLEMATTQPVNLNLLSLYQINHTLQRSTNLINWTDIQTPANTVFPWEKTSYSQSSYPAASARAFWRIKMTSSW